MPRPFLSVVMPTYNGRRFVAAALESVRREGIDGVEVLVIDDGSSDDTLEIVRTFEASLPLRIIAQGRVGSWVAASNLGLREARGDWVSFLHQDDMWLPGRLAALRRATTDPRVAFVLHPAMFIGPDGRSLGRWSCPLRPGLIESSAFVGRLLVQNFIAMPSPVFRRERALDGGGLDPALWYTADWDFWLRLGALGPVSFIGESLAAFRVHPESQTMARPARNDELRAQMGVVLDRHLRQWKVDGRGRQSIERVARLSIEVNAALVARSRRHPVSWGRLLRAMIALSPKGWYRYFRDSRIVERIWARMRLR
jgi:glycosyltransferase involved in cell wall biosynthesis